MTALRDKERISQPAEWLPAKTVLLCEPNMETLFGILETNSVNFLSPFSLKQAQAEHRAFRRAMESAGVQVIDVREALAGSGSPESLGRLQTWATTSVCYDIDESVSPGDRDLLRKNLQRTIQTLDPATLADLILLRPTLTIRYNENPLDPTSRFCSRYEVNPANNAFYMRDPLMTTASGCVIGRLRLDVRRAENDLAAHALEQLGIAPVYRVQPPGFLEGGDFIPCGDFVLQGQGLLSNAEGIRQCLEHRVYGFVEVGVVCDPRGQMDEMHLDTYLAVLDRDLCALCDNRLGSEQPTVDIYAPDGTPGHFAYKKTRAVRLTDYLEEKGMQVLTFSKHEQEDFAPNGLLLGPRDFIGVSRAGQAYERRLNQRGVQTRFLDFDALTCGYGGPHCMSQVIRRG
jgi:arginine deiminase